MGKRGSLRHVYISVLHGQGLGPKPGRQPAGWAGPLQNLNTSGLGRAGPSVSGPGRAWAGPGPNKNINTKPRFVILILIQTDYKLYFRSTNV